MPIDPKVEKKAESTKTNNIVIGIVEVSLFYFLVLAIDEMLIREYRINNPSESYSAVLFIFAVIFFSASQSIS